MIPRLAVKDVDFIHTDVWVSMGEPKEVWKERIALLTPYQVNKELMKAGGNPHVRFLHLSPASTTRKRPWASRSRRPTA